MTTKGIYVQEDGLCLRRWTMMHFWIEVKGRKFAANYEYEGVFELVAGAYKQHRGTSQTPKFRDKDHFRRFVQRMLRKE